MTPVGGYISRENEVDHRQAVKISTGRIMRPRSYSDEMGTVSVFLDLLNGPRRPWHLQAACCQPDVPTAWFFPDNDHEQYQQLRKAKKVCAGCPVIDQCRTEHFNEQHGVFFGTTPRDRQHLRAGTVRHEPKPRVQREASHGTVRRAVNDGCRCYLCLERYSEHQTTRRHAAEDRRARAKQAKLADVERSANAPSAVPGAVSSPFAAPGTSADLEDARMNCCRNLAADLVRWLIGLLADRVRPR